MKVNGLPRQGEEEATMSDEYLIKNTTREKRERIVNEALGAGYATDALRESSRCMMPTLRAKWSLRR